MTSALNFAKMTYFCIRFRLLVAELGFRGQGTGVSPLNLYRLISIADYIMLKTKISVEDLTLALPLKKVCYNVSLCESCQRQSCKAFIGLTIHAKMIGGGGGDPFYLKFWIKLTALERNRRFSISFRS